MVGGMGMREGGGEGGREGGREGVRGERWRGRDTSDNSIMCTHIHTCPLALHLQQQGIWLSVGDGEWRSTECDQHAAL